MSYYAQVAEMLGVELEERFRIKADEYVSREYYFSEDGGLCHEIDVRLNDTLDSLLCGVYKIIKQPWFPKDRDYYFMCHPNGTTYRFIYDAKYSDDKSQEERYQFEVKTLFKNGFGFKTEQESYDKGISLGWEMMPLVTR